MKSWKSYENKIQHLFTRNKHINKHSTTQKFGEETIAIRFSKLFLTLDKNSTKWRRKFKQQKIQKLFIELL